MCTCRGKCDEEEERRGRPPDSLTLIKPQASFSFSNQQRGNKSTNERGGRMRSARGSRRKDVRADSRRASALIHAVITNPSISRLRPEGASGSVAGPGPRQPHLRSRRRASSDAVGGQSRFETQRWRARWSAAKDQTLLQRRTRLLHLFLLAAPAFPE